MCGVRRWVAAVVLAAVMGAVVPLVFRRIGVDPAVASGPLITTLNDGLSLLLYFHFWDCGVFLVRVGDEKRTLSLVYLRHRR